MWYVWLRFFFFFSSRRRHTRSDRDWSSDVCSSDLRCVVRVAAGPRLGYGHLMRARALAQHLAMQVSLSVRGGRAAARTARSMGLELTDDPRAIDRADLLVVDDPSLKHGRPWIARARRAGVPSVSVHDCVPAHDADLVICGSIGIDDIRAAGTVLN